MSAENIYKRLINAGFTPAGACGMLGNLKAESDLRANNLQNTYEKKLVFVDELYTAAVNNGTYKNFTTDGAGYGLAQWTYGPRKRNLLNFAAKRGASIDDENMQVDFAIHELTTEYAPLLAFLRSTDDLYTATERICKEFERPAVNNVDRRYAFAVEFYNQFAGASVEPKTDTTETTNAWFPPDLSILVLQAVLVGNGYNTDITGYKNAHFLKTLRQFFTDIGG